MGGVLAGKSAIVTGGSMGIGFGIARALHAAGAKVMICARHEDGLEKAVQSIGANAAWKTANVGDPAQAQALVEATLERFGSVDILVNNAATTPYQGRLVEVDLARWNKTIDVNVTAPLVLTQACWRASMSERGGSVINISSLGAHRYGGPQGPYCVSKVALEYLTRHFASELGPKVRVNAIAPGMVPTRMSTSAAVDPQMPPLGRLGTPEDVAQAVIFLASDAASWITGQVIGVDGGALIAYPDRARKPS